MLLYKEWRRGEERYETTSKSDTGRQRGGRGGKKCSSATPDPHQNAALVWPKSVSAPLLFLRSTLLLSYSAVRERGLDGWMDVQEVNDGCRRWGWGGGVKLTEGRQDRWREKEEEDDEEVRGFFFFMLGH